MIDSIPSNSNLNYIPQSLDKFNNLILIRQVVQRRIGKIELGNTQELCLELPTQLNTHRKQIDLFDNAKFGCSKCCLKYKKIVEKERIFKFLFVLHKNLEEVRGRILGIKPFPPTGEVFFEFPKEESRKKIMMGNQVPLNLNEGFVLATCGTNPTHHNLAKEGRKTMV